MKPFTEIFGMNAPGEGDVRRVAMTAARAGYAVVPVKPMSKLPMCTHNQTERREIGTDHPCGVHHWSLDADRIDRDFKRLAKDVAKVDPDLHLNLGIVPGPSGLLMADADTPEAVEALQQWWDGDPNVRTPGVERDGEWVHKDGGHWYWELPSGIAMPTIKTQMTIDGVDFRWGSNLQALVPPSVRAEGPYVARGDVPEAPESVMGLILDWTAGIERTRAKKAEEARFANDAVAAWSVATSWDELLTPEGWTPSGRNDPGCGCPEWEKPGGGSSSKRSALAHDIECTKYPNVEGHGPLHVFTSDPPEGIANYHEATGSSTMTKLQYVAWTHHGGDTEVAKSALRIHVDVSEAFEAWFSDLGIDTKLVDKSTDSRVTEAVTEAPRVTEPVTRQNDPLTRDDATASHEKHESQNPTHEDSCYSSSTPVDNTVEDEVTREVVNEVEDEVKPRSFWMPHEQDEERALILKEAQLQYRRTRATEYVAHKLNAEAGTESFLVVQHGERPAEVTRPEIGHRRDGVPLLYRRRINCVFGKSENGKSWFTLAIAADVLSRGGKVVLIDIEDDYDGFATRMAQIGLEATDTTYVRLYAALDASSERELVSLCHGADLVIVDSFDGLLAINGYDTNAAQGIRAVGTTMKRLAKNGAALLLVDHSSEKVNVDRDPRDQMGSSAKKQFIDGALLYAKAREPWKPGLICTTDIEMGKDRHGWAKTIALYASPTDSWGRAAKLVMEPPIMSDDGETWAGNFELLVRAPELPVATETEVVKAELPLKTRILDGLREKPGEWHSRTKVRRMAGDPNGRTGQDEAIADLVAEGAILHRTVDLNAGKTGNEYMYQPLDTEGDDE